MDENYLRGKTDEVWQLAESVEFKQQWCWESIDWEIGRPRVWVTLAQIAFTRHRKWETVWSSRHGWICLGKVVTFSWGISTILIFQVFSGASHRSIGIYRKNASGFTYCLVEEYLLSLCAENTTSHEASNITNVFRSFSKEARINISK